MTYRRMSAPSGWFPRRGEICLAALDKERPVLIVSSNALNGHSLDVCVVPVSTAEHKAFSLRPRLRAGEGGLARDSWVKCDQVITIEKTVICYPPLGVIGPESLGRVEVAIKQALDLP
ncbi:MAG TPA: type II toxin-antitoxin system PemK/MazF family toxin [Bryobacteraceae bacterium]|nr:type II toxin-antitoxin system PemK/MazF family toxin [Bryobacteraceae bacterium]